MLLPADISRRAFLELSGAAAIPLLLKARAASAQTAGGVGAPPALIPVRDFVIDKVSKGIVPSLVVQVTRRGRPLWAEAFGFADLEQGRPATLQSIYKIMSITKPFTVSALMTLVDCGLVDFEAPANKYLRGPKLRAHLGSAENMTLRRLASHTSGIPDHEMLFFDFAPRLSPGLTVERYGYAAWRPGSRFEYSNLNTAILGFTSADVAGEPWDQFMQKALFQPLGLRSTFAELPRTGEAEAAGPATEHLTKQYDYDISGRSVRVAPHLTSHPGGSSMWSTVGDLTRFAEMHLRKGVLNGRRILSKKAVETMQQFTVPAKEPGVIYGNGWITHANLIKPNFNHSGGGPGATAMLAAFPEDGTVIAIVSNHYGGMVAEVTRRIAEALYNGVYAAPAASSVPAVMDGPSAVGRWKGFLRHHAGDIPLVLDVSATNAAEIKFSRMPAVKMTEVSAASGFLGTVVGPLMRDAGYHGDSIIEFVLRVEEGRLLGIADTYAVNYFEVAFWVELERHS